jgi:hypothetical protein
LQEIPKNLNGLWQSIAAFDIDLDGDKDIVLGNWGENNRFSKYIENPIHFYYGDLYNNTKREGIIAYNIDGQYYPLNTKDELASQMNIIHKRFLNHKDFALQPVEKVFTVEALASAKKSSIETLSSGYLENKNGKFLSFKRFENQLQVAPITSLTETTNTAKKQLLVSGNTLKVNTYHGGYTALKGFLISSIKEIKPSTSLGVEPFDNQIKETAILKMKNKKVLFVFANNDSLKTYSFKN